MARNMRDVPVKNVPEPGEGGYKRVGHVCAYKRGYRDAVEGSKHRAAYEKSGHIQAYQKGWDDGRKAREKALS